jgi:glycosyltransferase involved in cell wall biosynthesis
MINSASLKVSIITVCYNSEKTIETTIQSVTSQDYANIEYIIVDGNSSDHTMGVVDRYKKNINKIVSEPDRGIYDAMNKGIKMAEGDVIGILNSDDIFVSNTIISEIVKAFENDTEIAAVYGNIDFFKDELTKKVVRTWITKPYYPKFFDEGEVPPHPSLFVRKAVYDKIGTYFPDFKISSDYEFMFRAFKVHNYKPYYLDRFIVNMKIGGESTKSFKNILIGNKEVRVAWKMNNMRPSLWFWVLRVYKKIRQLRKQ